jgi:hypothetical protein
MPLIKNISQRSLISLIMTIIFYVQAKTVSAYELLLCEVILLSLKSIIYVSHLVLAYLIAKIIA